MVTETRGRSAVLFPMFKHQNYAQIIFLGCWGLHHLWKRDEPEIWGIDIRTVVYSSVGKPRDMWYL